MDDAWDGWSALWKLHTVPRVRHFLWRMFHSRTPTFAYLYRLNIGPARNWRFYDLDLEMDEHGLWTCLKIRVAWNVVGWYAGVDLKSLKQLTDG